MKGSAFALAYVAFFAVLWKISWVGIDRLYDTRERLRRRITAVNHALTHQDLDRAISGGLLNYPSTWANPLWPGFLQIVNPFSWSRYEAELLATPEGQDLVRLEQELGIAEEG